MANKDELVKCEKILDKKFLRFFDAAYKNKETGKERHYFFVSRNDEADLAIFNEKVKISAVEAFTYIKIGNEYKIVMIDEFRSALNRRMLSFCAGLVDEGEDAETAIKRELYEEVGGIVKKIEFIRKNPLPTSAGLTDEANVFAVVELSDLEKQHLQAEEDIKVRIFTLDEARKILNDENTNITINSLLGLHLLVRELSR